MTKVEINEKLESLVFKRFSKKELEKKLSKMFGTKVKVSEYKREECVKRDLPELDDQLLFEININDETDIDVDLFYLKDNGKNYLITETNFEYQ